MAASTAVTWENAPRGVTAAEKTAQIASLTGLRGLAALMVVVIHTSFFTEYSWIGVPDFGPVSLFVLSGFLLYRPWARWGLKTGERPSVRSFAWRRVARIYPAYLVVLCAVAVLYPPARPDGLLHWLRMASLTWIYHAGDYQVGMQHTWSLGTELSWYVALPIMGAVTTLVARRLTPRRAFWFTVGMLSLSLPITAAWRWWVYVEDLGQYFTYTFWLPGYLFCFAGGALVAHLIEGERAGALSLHRARRLAADPWALLVLALAFALLGTSPLGGPSGFHLPITVAEVQVRFVCATLIAVTLLVVAVLGRPQSPLNRALSTRWFNAIGRWSYGIYLWHLPVLLILERDISFPTGPAGLAWRLLWVVVISVPLSAATYAWVERPTIAWSRRAAGPRAARTASSRTPSQPSTEIPKPSRSESSAE